jgi:hypothetical protein
MGEKSPARVWARPRGRLARLGWGRIKRAMTVPRRRSGAPRQPSETTPSGSRRGADWRAWRGGQVSALDTKNTISAEYVPIKYPDVVGGVSETGALPCRPPELPARPNASLQRRHSAAAGGEMLEAAGPDLTRVIERAGWGLRSRSLSTCRLSATARSPEAAIPASECNGV